jgi:hypothetical protein
MHEHVVRAPQAGDIGPIRREIVFEPVPEPGPTIPRPDDAPAKEPAAPVRTPEPVPAES